VLLAAGFRVLAVFFAGCDVDLVFDTEASASGSNSSLSVTTVVGVQVVVEDTADLTASIFTCNEAI
jgi:hypothetical protein